MANGNFKIIKQLHQFPDEEGALWRKELNLVSWHGKAPKYDIRDWTEGHTHPGRGVTLSADELRELIEAAESLVY